MTSVKSQHKHTTSFQSPCHPLSWPEETQRMVGEEHSSKPNNAGVTLKKAGHGGFHVLARVMRRRRSRDAGKTPTAVAESSTGLVIKSLEREEKSPRSKNPTMKNISDHHHVERNTLKIPPVAAITEEIIVERSLPPNQGQSEVHEQDGSNATQSRANSACGKMPVTPYSSSKIFMNPTMEFLTADSTLELVMLMVLSIYPTYVNWAAVLRNELPFSVVIMWLLLAFMIGRVYSQGWALRRGWSQRVKVDLGAGDARGEDHTPDDNTGQVDKDYQISLLQEEKGRKHAIISSFLSAFHSSNKQLGFESAAKPWRGGVDLARRGKKTSREAWTVLMRSESRKISLPQWQKAGPTFSRDSIHHRQLMGHLARRGYLRRIRRAASHTMMKRVIRHSARDDQTSPHDEASVVVEVEPSETITLHSDLGSFDLATAKADSLEDFVIEPLFRLRGMDVFLADDPEYSVGTHPWLIEHGLRDFPTFIVNVLTQWGNILIYFQMPDWVTNWETFEETSSDPDDVKAVKRFFNGDDEYRNKRLKLIPSVVEGPLAVKILAPPKREQIVHCSYMPVTYIKHPAEVSNGRKLRPALEAELDCLTSRAIRGMAGIVKRHLISLSIDVAVVIGTPLKQHEEEPQACLGLWRFDHIDVSSCPDFPDRVTDSLESGQNGDVRRASQLVNISPMELEEIMSEQ